MSENSVLERAPKAPYDPFVVPPERREAIINWVVNKVQNWGLEVPAVFALELGKPLSFIVSQLLLIGGPVLYPIFGMERTEHLSQFLTDRENVEEIIRRIEQGTAGVSAQGEDGGDGSGPGLPDNS